MNRIDQKFSELKKGGKKAFIAFITAGDPDLKTTEEIVIAFERAGVDIVEMGVPFSDPLADGPTIQAASERALRRHVNLSNILNAVRRIRTKTQIPIALMTYYNPVFHHGEGKFVAAAKRSGVDGLIVPDLPPEEGKDLIRAARRQDLSTIFFLAPTTTKQRMPRIVKACTGFVYYVSLTGVTGSSTVFSAQNADQIALARKYTNKPICVGFGISTPAQVKTVARISDGVIVGSAIIQKIAKNKGDKNLVQNVSLFVRNLSKGLSA